MPKILNLAGNRYGHLTAVKRVKGDSRYATWECRCDCGNLIYVESRRLQSGKIVNCGCIKKDKNKKRVGRKAEDLTGRRYGKLVALYPLGKTEKSGSILWRCRCDCGNEVDVSVSSLNNGNNKSCGCLKKEYQKLVHDRLHLIDGTCVEWLDGRKSRSDNTSGFRGVFRKKNGKYSASIGFKKKIYYIGTFEEYNDAVEARLRAEKMIHDGFVEAHEYWLERAARDPDWGQENPFRFDVAKENGALVIRNSMDKFMEADKEADRKPSHGLILDRSNPAAEGSYADGNPRTVPSAEAEDVGVTQSKDKKKLVNIGT